MITTADEFVELCTSDLEENNFRARNDRLPDEVCLNIITRFPEMRRWVAQNTTVSQSVLRILAEDPDWRVRWTVAAKRSTDMTLLAKLAEDPDEGVRRRVAFNKKTPDWILELLLNDSVEDISDHARRRLTVSRRMVSEA